MNAGRDVERLITDWLAEEAPPGAPDRLLESARQAITRTSQRRFGANWRDTMNTTLARLVAIGAAAALTVGVVVWLGRPNGPSIGQASPTASTPALPGVPVSGAIPAGRYAIGQPFPQAIEINLSAGWEVWGTTTPEVTPIFKLSPDPPGVGIVFGTVANVFADPCNEIDGLASPPIGATVDEFLSAITKQPSTEVSSATDVTVAGYDAKHAEYSFGGNVAACPSLARFRVGGGATRMALPTEKDEVWLFEVDDKLFIIDLFSFESTDPALIEEARAMVEDLSAR